MDLDPLSFFANEAEKDKPSEKETVPPTITHHVSATSNLLKELEVGADWVDKERRAAKRGNKSTKDVAVSRGDARSNSTPSTARSRNTTPPDVSGDKDTSVDIPSLDTYIKMLTGEATIIKLPDVLMQLYEAKIVPGTLFMTTYRLSFLPSPAHLMSIGTTNPSVYSMFNVPLSCIDKIEREKKHSKPQSILITCKDMRQHRIFLKGMVDSKTSETVLSDDEIDRAFSAMYRYAFPNNIRHVFAFCSSPPPSLKGVYLPAELFSMEREFRRQGVLGSKNWRLSSENNSFKLCDTYPKLLVVPASIDDVQLHNVAGFRSGHRFPALSYYHANNGASIWRSSQPKAGVSGRNSVDELFLDLIARSTSSRVAPSGQVRAGNPQLFIIDCRPVSSAMANRAAGAGYEVSNNYPNTSIEFFNIGNIHVMRDSLKAMAGVFATNLSTSNDISFGKTVEDVGWLTHVRLVLKASWDCAMSVVKGVPVLVHCSHGWDRTSQVLCLAQMLLDPYFRTFDGFAALVEKDFVSFGHPFQWRCGHGFDAQTRPDKEISPIFLQFLDCTYQLVVQFPQYFEFSPKFVLVVLDHVYSCRFGTFLGNSDKERAQMGRDECMSLWSYLKYNKAVLASPHYLDPRLEGTPTTHLLLPNLSRLLRNVTVWKEFFYRWSAVPSLLDPPHVIFKEIHENGIMQPATDVNDGDFDEPLGHSDFDVPSMSSSTDCWEALYRQERRLRLSLQQKLAALGGDSDVVLGEERSGGKETVAKVEVAGGGVLSVVREVKSFLDGNDEFGLLASVNPSLMFGDDDDDDVGGGGHVRVDRVDLLAMAALNDAEKETTDDEGDHVGDQGDNEAT